MESTSHDGQFPDAYPPRPGPTPTQESSQESSSRSTPSLRRPSVAPGEARKEKHRVRFTPGGESLDPRNNKSTFDLRDSSDVDPSWSAPSAGRESISKSMSTLPTLQRFAQGSSLDQEVLDGEKAHDHLMPPPPVAKPRPLLRRRESANSDIAEVEEEGIHDVDEKTYSQAFAHDRAERLSRVVGSSLPLTARNTPVGSPELLPRTSGRNGHPIKIDDIPLIDLHDAETREADSDEDNPRRKKRGTSTSEAHQLVRTFTHKGSSTPDHHEHALRSGYVTPVEEQDPDLYVPPPQQYRGGILSSLLKLYNSQDGPSGGSPNGAGAPSFQSRHGSSDETHEPSPNHTPGTPGSSGTATPRTQQKQKWYQNKSASHSTSSITGLIESSSVLGTLAAAAGTGDHYDGRRKQRTPPHRKKGSNGSRVSAALNRMSRPRLEDEIRITVHIAETLSRQRYLLKLCRALMLFGAPTHRLEEYMKMTARVLEIDGQFLYIPGCMIISFDDSSTHTTEVKLIRSSQGVDLGKLRDTHEIYKEVVHDKIGVEEATVRLDEVQKRKQKFNKWVLVIVYGLASACVGPFAFQARLIDLPISFTLGTLLGILQLIVAPKSDLYANVFEISAAVLTSFLARAFGSIKGGNVFCFSALAQSAIALILPGYTVLCGSLELQSRSIVAGSVRMVYAIIYSLFLGFGITIGTAIYGLIDTNATSDTQCQNPMPEYWTFLFVPAFTMCLIVINQGTWPQSPVMIVIAFAGFVTNFFSGKKFASNAQVSNTLGAFVIGVLGNLYSRLHHGVAAAAILPAIFVQVPSGLAAGGSLVSGVTSADQITNTANGTAAGRGGQTVSSGTDANGQVNSVIFNVGYSMIQVAIGITVGLFLSALVVYPFGKRRSGLFSF